MLEHLLQAGAQVMAADCEWQLLLEQSEPLLGRYPDQLTLKKLDLAEPEAVREQVNQWAEQVAGFDHLVCCAGILHVAPLHDMPL
ncbi:SDR family oxidoreductase, partial [Vibrio cholerae]|uniref:SDR family oxidoreductase n=1 Tax=Vibrio cholerae TaxID=666 RepID=UPI0021CC34F4